MLYVIIVPCSHYLDEADILGDRIVIMNEGQIRCSGSSLFLKNRFGAGYVLSLAKAASDVQVALIENDIQGIIPGAQISSAVAGEVIFHLPLNSLSSFPDLFKMLVDKSSQLGVSSYGISITSLEQVFIGLVKASRETTSGEGVEDSLQSSLYAFYISLYLWIAAYIPQRFRRIMNYSYASGDAKSYRLWQIQLYELLMKRWISARRDVKGFVFGVVFPALQILAVLAILTISINPSGSAIQMNASVFPTTPIVARGGEPSTWLYGDLSESTMSLQNVPSLTSDNLSALMIEKYYTGYGSENGAYIFSDTVDVEFNVDWVQLKALLQSEAFSQLLLSTFGENITLASNIQLPLNSPYLNLTSPSSAAASLVGNLFGNLSIISLNGISVQKSSVEALIPRAISNTTIINALASILGNGTIIFNGISLSANSTIKAVDRIISALSNSSESGTVSIGSIVYEVKPQVFVANDVSLQLSTVGVVPVGEVQVPLSTVLRSFPNHEVTYNLPVSNAYTVMHNSTSPHGAAAFRGELVRTAFGQCVNDQLFDYGIRNHPMPPTAQQSLTFRIILAIFTSIFIVIPLCYIPSAFIVFIVKERACKSQHLQYVSSGNRADMLSVS